MNKNEDERGEGGGVSEKYLEVKLEAEYGERNMLTLFVSAFISDKRNIVYWQTHVRAHWPICETRARRRLLATCALQNALRITRRPISGADIETALSHSSWKKRALRKPVLFDARSRCENQSCHPAPRPISLYFQKLLHSIFLHFHIVCITLLVQFIVESLPVGICLRCKIVGAKQKKLREIWKRVWKVTEKNTFDTVQGREKCLTRAYQHCDVNKFVFR